MPPTSNNIIDISSRFRRIRGVCAHCIWTCGALGDSCDNPSVEIHTGRPMIKALAARTIDSICGSDAKHWSARP
jgi:hypothetical protein